MSGALSSPGFDPAIALQAGRGVAPPNPLQTVGQFADIQNKINQTQLFPGAMELQQQRIAGGKADLFKTWKQAAALQLAPLLAEGANPTLADATTVLGRLEAAGMSMHDPSAALAGMTDGPNFRSQLGAWVAPNLATPGNEVGSVIGAPDQQITNQGIIAGVRRPVWAGGGFVPGSFTQETLSPQQNKQLRDVEITRENYQQYGKSEADIGKVIQVPEGAFPYPGTTGQPPTTYTPGQQPGGTPQPPRPGQRSDAGGTSPMLAQVQAPGGARFTVAASVAPQFQGLVADLEAAGYKINPKDVSSYRPGAVVAGTNTPSQHASAFAIDVNASNNRVGTPGEIPPDLARSLAAKYGLRWGGDFSHNRDPMHFDALRPRSDAGDTAGPQGTQVASLGLPSGVMSDVPSGIIPAAAPGSSPPSISEGPDLNILRQGGSTKSSQPGVRDYMLNQSPVAQNMANRVASFRSEMYPLLAAQDALAKAPTGKGSETLQSVSSYINTFAPELLQRALSHISPILSKDEVAAYDEARKYTTQIQLGAPGATRSNEGQAAAGAANPSVGISNEAAKVVLKGLISLRRMEQDEGQSWIKSKRPPAELNNFRAEFQNQTDPRMYLFDQMSPTERSQTLASFGDNTRKRMEFMAGVERAERNGVLSAPRGGQ